MKKINFIKPLMVVASAATPLCGLASCSSDAYVELAAQIKEETINLFMTGICPLHRATWDCGEAFGYIWEYMSNLDNVQFGQPAGYDLWSKISEVKNNAVEALFGHEGTYPETWKEGFFSDITPLAIMHAKNGYGNIWYDLPATKGHEHDAPITLQSHYDMSIRFANNAWNAWSNYLGSGGVKADYDQDNEILKAKPDTTPLGADNGLGVALMLEIAKHRNDFTHGPVRLLFTVDESASTDELSAGADLLRYDQIYGKYVDDDGTEYTIQGQGKKPFGENWEYSNVLSLNALVKGQVYASSAGMHDCFMSTPDTAPAALLLSNKHLTEIPQDNQVGTSKNPVYKIAVSGLHGGHSSEDINKGYANAVQILMQTITDSSTDNNTTGKYGFHILHIDSPSITYAIPEYATAYITSSIEFKQEDVGYDLSTDEILQKKVEIFKEMMQTAYPYESDIEISLTKVDDLNKASEADKKIIDDVNDVGAMLSYERSRELCEFFDSLYFGALTFFPGTNQTEVLSSQNFGRLSVSVAKYGTDDAIGNISFHVVIRSADEDQRSVLSLYAHSLANSMLNWVTKSDRIYDMELPIWANNKNDKLVKLASNGFSKLGYKPNVTNLHGWVEVACIPRIFKLGGTEKIPYICCIGPTIEDGHTLSESVWTDTMTSWIRCALYSMGHASELKG